MNYYEEISRMLGVELGEEFSLKDNRTEKINNVRYKITQEAGLMYSITEMKWSRSTLMLAIIDGIYSVAKLPWKPKNGELYWHYSEAWDEALSCDWEGGFNDLLFWKCGNCFKTNEEAKAKGKDIMEQIRKEFEES